MAWAYVQTIEDVGLDTYDAVAAEIGEVDPDGALVHVAGTYEGKLRILEVWESEAHYQQFREERLTPALRKVMGDDALSDEWPPPGFEAMDVHALLGVEETTA